MTASSGKTALFAWELGEGLGHLPVLKAIAEALQREGWTIVFALRDPVLTRASLASLNCAILPAPHWPNPVAVAKPSFTYADILAANGFGAVEHLSSLLETWDDMLDVAKPDLIVCEHSPGVVMAGFERVPVAIVGNGFIVPPADGATFPAYKSATGEMSSQGGVLAVMQEALMAKGRAAPASITEPFRTAFRAVYAFPELDPYRAIRRDAVLGPMETMPPLTPLPSKRKLFVYSASDYALIDELIAALMDIGPQASVFLRGKPGAKATVLKSRGASFFEEAPKLAETLPQMSCVFSHAGSGLVSAALAAGRPQILNPRHGEATLTANALQEMGVGISLPLLERQHLREAIERVHADAKFASAAQRAGETAQAFLAQANALESTLGALRALV